MSYDVIVRPLRASSFDISSLPSSLNFPKQKASRLRGERLQLRGATLVRLYNHLFRVRLIKRYTLSYDNASHCVKTYMLPIEAFRLAAPRSILPLRRRQLSPDLTLCSFAKDVLFLFSAFKRYSINGDCRLLISVLSSLYVQ